MSISYFFFFQAEDGIRDLTVTGVQTCALPIYRGAPLLRRLVERSHVGPKQLVELCDVVGQPGTQLLQPRCDDLVRRLGVGKREAEAEPLQPVLQAVEGADMAPARPPPHGAS